MSIKSEKAKRMIIALGVGEMPDPQLTPIFPAQQAIKLVEFAESEAEQRDRDRAVRAFDKLDFSKFIHIECIADFNMAYRDLREQFLMHYDNGQ